VLEGVRSISPTDKKIKWSCKVHLNASYDQNLAFLCLLHLFAIYCRVQSCRCSESHVKEGWQTRWAKLLQEVHLNIRDIELQYLSSAFQYGTNTATTRQVEGNIRQDLKWKCATNPVMKWLSMHIKIVLPEKKGCRPLHMWQQISKYWWEYLGCVRPRSPCTNSLIYVPAYIKQCNMINKKQQGKGMVLWIFGYRSILNGHKNIYRRCFYAIPLPTSNRKYRIWNICNPFKHIEK
jgi:hypothetical protein